MMMVCVCRLGQLMLQPATEIRTRTLTTIAQLLHIKVCMSLCLSLGLGVLCGGCENDDGECRLGQLILQPPTERNQNKKIDYNSTTPSDQGGYGIVSIPGVGVLCGGGQRMTMVCVGLVN